MPAVAGGSACDACDSALILCFLTWYFAPSLSHSPSYLHQFLSHNPQGEQGFRALNGVGSNFALLGTPGSSLLGGGAFGQVYKAIHFPTMRRVAIKKIPKDFGRTNDYANSFARELRNLYTNVQRIAHDPAPREAASAGGGLSGRPLPPPSALHRTARDAAATVAAAVANTGAHCPYLLTLYDAYIERNPTNLCLVLEYMEGGSLEQLMARTPGGCDDEGFLREVCHNVLKVKRGRIDAGSKDNEACVPRLRCVAYPHRRAHLCMFVCLQNARACTTSTCATSSTRTSSPATSSSRPAASPSWPTLV